MGSLAGLAFGPATILAGFGAMLGGAVGVYALADLALRPQHAGEEYNLRAVWIERIKGAAPTSREVSEKKRPPRKRK